MWKLKNFSEFDWNSNLNWIEKRSLFKAKTEAEFDRTQNGDWSRLEAVCFFYDEWLLLYNRKPEA